VRLLGEYLAARGLHVLGPLLPGHGTVADDLNCVRWQDWVATAQEALARLRQRHRVVFVGGLSMGALVALHLAAARGTEIAGLLLYAPALRVANRMLPLTPLLRHLVAQFPASDSTDLTDPEAPMRLWHYATFPVAGAAQLYRLQRVVRRELGDIRTPALVFYSSQDGTIHPHSAPAVYAGLGSPIKEIVQLEHSGHCMTVDVEREAIFARSYAFIQRMARPS
jgi:carboxylesterase